MIRAPELQVEHWLNTSAAITLERLRGRVVFIEAFQLLCPGCVAHGLPQATRVVEAFGREDVVVLGLHCVFEHHAAQSGRDLLEAFLDENRIRFPVGIDMPGSGAVPKTMAAYRLRGTPTSILIDREGRLRARYFGRVPDMALGAEIMALVEDRSAPRAERWPGATLGQEIGCDENGCAVVSQLAADEPEP